ncbi:hypothetical protein [Pedobacter steynii]|nr:hypothetical protein [Pedobacter steynii]
MNNYQQPQTEGHDEQTVLIDPAITGETDEMDPTFYQDGPPVDPEEEEEEDDDDFPSREDLEDDEYDLNHDTEDDLSLNTDDDDDF